MFLTPTATQARTTPEDILNSQKDAYNSQVKNYTAQDKQKLDLFSQKIANLNQQATYEWEWEMVRQGDILDEYLRRNNFKETEGIKNARYWLTYAHEAVAYQAAKVYVYNLTSEKNLNTDVLSQVNILQSDLNILRNKVLKSQGVITSLVGQ
jgi:PDZ domain-containing secreted protein